MGAFNVFRILADIAHTLSKVILIWQIYSNKSAEGVSLLTQLLYILVFSTRYLDLFWTNPLYSFVSLWNFSLKIFYIISSFFIVFLMMRVFVRTREKEAAWRLATWSLLGSLFTAPLFALTSMSWRPYTFFEVSWTFSLELESVCVLPQLLLLRQTSVPTVIDSYYLVMLGSYRFLYILNWIIRYAQGDPPYPQSVIFGVVQTALYLDFAWVYYSRQRVKLRGGGIVDGDDLNKGLLVNRLLSTRARNTEGAEEDGPDDADDENETVRPSGRVNQSWGARGISVSADDTLPEHELRGATEIVDPAAFEVADDAEYADDEDLPPPPPAKDIRHSNDAGNESSAQEWSGESGSRGL